MEDGGRRCQPSPQSSNSGTEDSKRGVESALHANPQDLRDQYEKQLKGILGESDVGPPRTKNGSPAGQGREAIEKIQQGLKEVDRSLSVSNCVSRSVYIDELCTVASMKKAPIV